MPTVGPQSYLMLSAVLFAIGLAGLLLRRNIFTMLMCLQLTLAASTLAFVAHGRALGDLGGQVFALVAVAESAAQLAVGVAIAMALYRTRGVLLADDIASLREDL